MLLNITPEANMQFILAQMVANGGVLGNNMVGMLTPEELTAWDARAAVITENYRWFTGEALEERDESAPGDDGQYPLLFPLQLNPFKDAARLHAFALWGMAQDTSAPLVQTKCDPRRSPEGEIAEEERKIAAWADEVLLNVDYENNSRSADVDMGLDIQALGGIVLKVSWEGNNPLRPSGIRYDYYDSRQFHCRFKGKSYWELDEVWIKSVISREEALATYGVKIDGIVGTHLEYWNRESFFISIDGKPASIADKTRVDGRRPLAEEHDFGFVPFIYVPHERAGGFWGTSIIDGAIGMVKEMNAREADIGDAIHLGVNSIVVARNLRGGAVEQTLSNGQIFYNLGKNSAGEDKPEMDRIKEPQLPANADNFVARVRENLNHALVTPSIAYGEEEGSQRSGQTLHSRMWPLLSHVSHERIHWTEARNLRAEYALRILAKKKMCGITERHLGLRKRQLWQPMVPVDRTALVDELIKRKQVDAISLEHMIAMLGDVTDIPEEIERIKALLEFMQELEMRQTEMQLEAQAEMADKQLEAQAEQTDKQQEGQERLADKAAKTQVQVAKQRPKPAAPAAARK